jgi:Na+/phosphate symporter
LDVTIIAFEKLIDMIYQILGGFISFGANFGNDYSGIGSTISLFHPILMTIGFIHWIFYVILLIIILFLLLLLLSKSIFKKGRPALIADESTDLSYNVGTIIESCNQNTVKAIISTSKAYFLCFEGFFSNDRQQMKNAITEAEEFDKRAKKLKDDVFIIIEKLQQDQIETGHFYVQVVDYLREMAHSLNYALKPVLTHFENRHKPFDSDQISQFNEFRTKLNDFFNFSLYILKEKRYDNLDELIDKRKVLVEKLKTLEKNHIKRIKSNTVSTRNSVLYFNIITETKSLLLNLINVVKAQRDFVGETKLNND